MLLPESVQPELSIYYNGAMVLKELQESDDERSVIGIYQKVKEKHGMTFPVFLLSLDWLYLTNVAIVDQKGEIQLCS